MMAVRVESGPEFVAGRPEVLFEMESHFPYPQRTFGITPDGRFVMIEPLHESTRTQIHVVVHWAEEVRRLVPAN
jgi:hypothetical protein